MFEVFFEPPTDDEREFQHALWLLSGFAIRERTGPTEIIDDKRIAQSQQEIEEMRDRIRNTNKFASLSDKQQRWVLKGKRDPKYLGKSDSRLLVFWNRDLPTVV